jgi:hypothetical protein
MIGSNRTQEFPSITVRFVSNSRSKQLAEPGGYSRSLSVGFPLEDDRLIGRRADTLPREIFQKRPAFTGICPVVARFDSILPPEAGRYFNGLFYLLV